MAQDSLTPPHCLVIGNSHVAALQSAWAPGRSVPMRFVNLWTLILSGEDIAAHLVGLCQDMPTLRLVCTVFGSGAHNRAAFLESPEPFSTADARGWAVPENRAGRLFIPRDLMAAYLRGASTRMMALQRRVSSVFRGLPALQLGTPPPVRGGLPGGAPGARTSGAPGLRGLRDAPPGGAVPAEALASVALDVADIARRLRAGDVPPPELRLELFRLQDEIYMDEARRLGATFLAAPEGALDPQGFLIEDLALKDDPTHAGPAYGRLVLNQIDRHLGGLP